MFYGHLKEVPLAPSLCSIHLMPLSSGKKCIEAFANPMRPQEKSHQAVCTQPLFKQAQNARHLIYIWCTKSLSEDAEKSIGGFGVEGCWVHSGGEQETGSRAPRKMANNPTACTSKKAVCNKEKSPDSKLKRVSPNKSRESPPPQSYKSESAYGDLGGYWKHPAPGPVRPFTPLMFLLKLEVKGSPSCPPYLNYHTSVQMFIATFNSKQIGIKSTSRGQGGLFLCPLAFLFFSYKCKHVPQHAGTKSNSIEADGAAGPSSGGGGQFWADLCKPFPFLGVIWKDALPMKLHDQESFLSANEFILFLGVKSRLYTTAGRHVACNGQHFEQCYKKYEKAGWVLSPDLQLPVSGKLSRGTFTRYLPAPPVVAFRICLIIARAGISDAHHYLHMENTCRPCKVYLGDAHHYLHEEIVSRQGCLVIAPLPGSVVYPSCSNSKNDRHAMAVRWLGDRLQIKHWKLDETMALGETKEGTHNKPVQLEEDRKSSARKKVCAQKGKSI
eukprot:1154143-Pelagomonas_calceolata.AAC.5